MAQARASALNHRPFVPTCPSAVSGMLDTLMWELGGEGSPVLANGHSSSQRRPFCGSNGGDGCETAAVVPCGWTRCSPSRLICLLCLCSFLLIGVAVLSLYSVHLLLMTAKEGGQ